jgi:hypothetical protein
MASGKKYLVVSHGGVGTHAVAKFIRPNCRLGFNPVRHHPSLFVLPFVSHDYGKNRHVNPVRMLNGDDVRVIYVFGDPRNAACSFFRRRAKNNAWLRLAVANLGGNASRVGPMLTLEKYVNDGRDLFGFEQHVKVWTGGESRMIEKSDGCSYPILAVRYETMYEHVHDIAEFVGLSGMEDKFPPHRPRKCDWSEYKPAVVEGLSAMYGGLSEYEEALPDCWRVR